MNTITRHDVITLHNEILVEDFVAFATTELIPKFGTRFKGPTRTSRADVKHQSMLQDAGDPRKFVWITVWDGGVDSVRGASFEHARMNRVEDADALLKTLGTFGKRDAEHVFTEVIDVDVDTNH
jgi:hypothetical protein